MFFVFLSTPTVLLHPPCGFFDASSRHLASLSVNLTNDSLTHSRLVLTTSHASLTSSSCEPHRGLLPCQNPGAHQPSFTWTARCSDAVVFCDELCYHNLSFTSEPLWMMYSGHTNEEWRIHIAPSSHGMNLFMCYLSHCDCCSEHLFTVTQLSWYIFGVAKTTEMSNSLTHIFKLWPTL